MLLTIDKEICKDENQLYFQKNKEWQKACTLFYHTEMCIFSQMSPFWSILN